MRKQLQHAGHRDRRERHRSTPDMVIKPRLDRSYLLILSIQSLRRTRSPSLTGSCRSSVSVMTSMWGRDSTGLRSYRWTWVSYVSNPTRTSDKAPPSSLREDPARSEGHAGEECVRARKQLLPLHRTQQIK